MAENSKIAECWLDIPEFEDQYQVSDFGHVKRVPHAITRGDGVKQSYQNNISAIKCGRSWKHVEANNG